MYRGEPHILSDPLYVFKENLVIVCYGLCLEMVKYKVPVMKTQLSQHCQVESAGLTDPAVLDFSCHKLACPVLVFLSVLFGGTLPSCSYFQTLVWRRKGSQEDRRSYFPIECWVR